MYRRINESSLALNKLKQLQTQQKCFSALNQHNNEFKHIKVRLTQILQNIENIKLNPFFYQWRDITQELKLESQANSFFVCQRTQFIIKRAFQSWRIYHAKKINNQEVQVYCISFYHQNLLRKYFKAIAEKNEQSKLIIEKESQLVTARRAFIKAQVLSELMKYAMIKKLQARKVDQVQSKHKLTLIKKGLLSWQRYHYLQQGYTITAYRHQVSQRFEALQEWKRAYIRAKGADLIMEALQQVKDHMLKKKFIERLVKIGYYQTVFEALQTSKLERYARSFFSLLKRSMIQSQIVHGYSYARSILSKRKVLDILKHHTEARQQRVSMLESQLYLAQQQTNWEVARSCFDELKAYAYQMRLNKVASSLYQQKLVRKGILGIQIIAQRQQAVYQLEHKMRQQQLMGTLIQWIQAFQISRQEKDVTMVTKNSLKQKVLNAWHQLTQTSKLAYYFRTSKLSQSVMPLCFKALQAYSLTQKQLKHNEIAIKSNNAFQLLRQTMLGWMEYRNLKKLSANLRTYHIFKQSQIVLSSWRQVAERNNRQRYSLRLIRKALNKRPYLVKPLLAIRQVTVYKAFQALKLGTKNSNREIQLRNQSCHTFYLSLLRKAFYSLKYNASLRQQDAKVDRIRDYFRMRRNFNQLVHNTQQNRHLRATRTKAAILNSFNKNIPQRQQIDHKLSRDIFKVLSIQRKAFQALLQYADSRQQLNIKYQFAEELYYKRLADRVFLGFKLVLQEKMVNSGISNQSSKVNDQTIGMNQSRFEQEISQMAIECTQVMDSKEKKRLVYELFQKKMLFKCFMSWASLALEVSDDEDEDQQFVIEDENEISSYSN